MQNHNNSLGENMYNIADADWLIARITQVLANLIGWNSEADVCVEDGSRSEKRKFSDNEGTFNVLV
jgi:hypothetical protein